MIPGKSMRIDTVKTNARITTLHVKGSAFSRCIHEVCQHWTHNRPHAQVLTKYGSQAPQRRAEVEQTLCVPRNMAKLFKGDAKAQNCRFVDTTAVRNLLQRQACISRNKDVQHTQGAFYRFDTAGCVHSFGIVGHIQTFRHYSATLYSQLRRDWKSSSNKVSWND